MPPSPPHLSARFPRIAPLLVLLAVRCGAVPAGRTPSPAEEIQLPVLRARLAAEQIAAGDVITFSLGAALPFALVLTDPSPGRPGEVALVPLERDGPRWAARAICDPLRDAERFRPLGTRFLGSARPHLQSIRLGGEGAPRDDDLVVTLNATLHEPADGRNSPARGELTARCVFRLVDAGAGPPVAAAVLATVVEARAENPFPQIALLVERQAVRPVPGELDRIEISSEVEVHVRVGNGTPAEVIPETASSSRRWGLVGTGRGAAYVPVLSTDPLRTPPVGE